MGPPNGRPDVHAGGRDSPLHVPRGTYKGRVGCYREFGGSRGKARTSHREACGWTRGRVTLCKRDGELRNHVTAAEGNTGHRPPQVCAPAKHSAPDAIITVPAVSRCMDTERAVCGGHTPGQHTLRVHTRTPLSGDTATKQARAVSHGVREHLLRPEEPECAVPSRERVPEAPGGRLAGAALRPPPARPGHRRRSAATTPGPEPPPAQTYLVGGVGGGGRDVSTSRAAALRHHCGNKGCVSGPAPTRAGHGSPPRTSCEEAAPGTRSAARRDRPARHLPPGPRHPAAGRFPPPFTLPRQKPPASPGCRVGRTPTLSPARPQAELHREAGTRVRLRPAQRGPGRARGGAGLRAGSLCARGRAFVLGSPLPATGERWQTRCSPSRRTARVCGENAPRMLDAERLGRGHRGRVAHGPQGPGP